jgi:hypothetical protein
MDIPRQEKPRRGLIRFPLPLLMMGGGYLLFVFGAFLQPLGLAGLVLALWGLVKAIRVF